MRKILFSLIILFILPFSVSAEEIEQFISDIQINTNGSVSVTEKILYDFESLERHGIIREIPQSYGSGANTKYYTVNVQTVTDENGNEYPYTESGYYYLELKIGDPDETITGKHWYYITYSIDGVINGFEDYDELYWNVTGTEWEVPIAYAEANISLPKASKNNQATCYTGLLGEQSEQCTAESNSDTTFIFKTINGADAYEGLTIVAGFDKDIVTSPTVIKTEKIEKFITHITINEDSSVDVVERILYDFGTMQKHGIYRTIPESYGLGIDEISYDISVKSVTDENNNPIIYEDTGYYDVSLKIGDPDKTITGKHWYFINYTMEHAITGFEDHDELYWNVTGNDWYYPIEYAEANITLPGESLNNSATCYTGHIGDQEQNCLAGADSATTFKFKTDTYQLGATEGLTVVAGFEKGLVTLPAILKMESDPSYANITINKHYTGEYTPHSFHLDPGTHEIKIDEFKFRPYKETFALQSGETKYISATLEKSFIGIFLETILPIISWLIISLALFLMWWLKGRDPEGRGSIYPIYEPPGKLTPGEIGVIVDQKAHLHDISATIIKFAVEGYIKIKKLEKKDYQFSIIKVPDLSKFEIFEKKIWVGIFGTNKKSVKLSSLNQSFYVNLEKIKTELYDLVVRKKFFEKSPESRRKTFLSLGIISAILLFIGGLILGSFLLSGWYVVFGTLLALEAIFFFLLMPRRTKKGALMQEKILGFKMYLKHAERYRLKRLYSPKNYKDLFEKYLPYAIALEVEKEWAKQFKDMFNVPPSWYEGDNFKTFNTLALVNSLSTFNRASAGSMVSRPSSSGGSYSGWSGGSSSWSGGSGFSSGGYSGGGFSGGGGGSW